MWPDVTERYMQSRDKTSGTVFLKVLGCRISRQNKDGENCTFADPDMK